MRSSVFLTSALAMGALARPRHRHRQVDVVTETDVVVTTVIVYVTEGNIVPASTSLALSTTTSREPVTIETTGAPASSPSSSSPSPEPAVAPTSALEPAREPEPAPPAYELVSTLTSASTPTPTPIPTSTGHTETPPPSSSTTQASGLTAASGNHLTGSDQAYLSSGSDYQAAVLYHHNAARANHDATPLTWDSGCEANALIAAKKCTFEHYIPNGAGEGQNLFTVSGDAFNVTAGITESWYKGELPAMMPYFGQNNIPDNVFESVGHLTQLVWKGTTKVGCASIDCGASMIVGGSTSTMNKFTVCNYAPAGNIDGAYAVNVAAPISTNNLGGWAD